MSRLRAVPGRDRADNLDTGEPITVGCAEPAVLVAFWSAALGYEPDPGGGPGVIADPAGSGPRLRFRSGPSGDVPRLEVEVTGGGPFVRHQALVEAEVARLVALGATVVGRATRRGGFGVELTDPDGNAFTVG